jgi:cytochrome c
MRMRQTKARAACLFGLAYALLAASQVFAGALPDKGEVLITKNCVRCHAIGATGESTHKEAPPFRQVVTRYPIENLAEALAEGILSGHPDMPEFVFAPGEIDAILSYLEKLKVETHGGDSAPKDKSP